MRTRVLKCCGKIDKWRTSSDVYLDSLKFLLKYDQIKFPAKTCVSLNLSVKNFRYLHVSSTTTSDVLNIWRHFGLNDSSASSLFDILGKHIIYKDKRSWREKLTSETEDGEGRCFQTCFIRLFYRFHAVTLLGMYGFGLNLVHRITI
jgi:hypothetical protein